ncbi:MAG TPA: hypothetical protein VIL85_20580 [Thermomicrobiales bacterium]|jgi:nitrogen regulatory protein P-II 2
MQPRTLTLITIVVEELLAERLVRDLQRAGMTGYTRGDVRGEGRRHLRDPWEGNNVRIESLVTAEVAERMLARLTADYLPHYAIVAWTSEVRAFIAEGHIVAP